MRQQWRDTTLDSNVVSNAPIVHYINRSTVSHKSAVVSLNNLLISTDSNTKLYSVSQKNYTDVIFNRFSELQPIFIIAAIQSADFS